MYLRISGWLNDALIIHILWLVPIKPTDPTDRWGITSFLVTRHEFSFETSSSICRDPYLFHFRKRCYFGSVPGFRYSENIGFRFGSKSVPCFQGPEPLSFDLVRSRMLFGSVPIIVPEKISLFVIVFGSIPVSSLYVNKKKPFHTEFTPIDFYRRKVVASCPFTAFSRLSDLRYTTSEYTHLKTLTLFRLAS
jgi:hypothetical protein